MGGEGSYTLAQHLPYHSDCPWTQVDIVGVGQEHCGHRGIHAPGRGV